MMVRNKIKRIKAAFISAAMVATTLAAPVMTSFNSVTAATKEVSSLPYTLVADGVTDGKRQANVALPKGVGAGDKITLNFTTSSTVDATVAVYGFGTDSEADDYWVNCDETTASDGLSEFDFTVTVPSMKGNATKIGVGIWYPKDDSEWTLESIEVNGSSSSTDPTDPAEPTIPTTANNKSGTCSLIDNKDGTATIIATLAAQYGVYDEDGVKQTEIDYVLSLGKDEEDYAPYKDADGNTLPEYNPETDIINSHKFQFSGFGIDDMANITFESFEYVITCDEYSMSEIQYGGGINVTQASAADTEYIKGKDGYWYNDQGTEDMEAWGNEFLIDDVHGAYKAENAGNYAKIVWDVPKGVQPCVDLSGNGSVGLQYWWGKDDSVATAAAEEGGDVLNFTEIPSIHVKSAIAVYTRTMTVPYNKSIQGPTDISLTSGSDDTNQTKLSLADLELGERDKISAVEFTFESAEALQKFVGGYGISVKEDAVGTGVDNGWYQGNDVAVIDCDDNTFKVMWILPDTIRDNVYSDGELLIGYWYGDITGGTPVEDITISDVQYHVYISQEDDIVIKGEDGLELPETLELKVGDTYVIDSNVAGSTFTSSNDIVATIDEDGLITALRKGTSDITVTTPEGQEVVIALTVVEAEVTTTTAPVTTTTTTTTTTTAVDPDTVIDWTRVLYGDVNVSGEVDLADLTYLAKHLLNAEIFPLKNATAKENSDCKYDGEILASDSSMLAEYILEKIGLLDLGPKDKSNCPMYNNLV